jgi:hypothetical protein
MKTKYASNSPELEQLLQTNTRMAKIQRNTIPVIESLPGFVSRFDGVDSIPFVSGFCEGWHKRDSWGPGDAHPLCVVEVTISGMTRFFIFRGDPIEQARLTFAEATVKMVVDS